MLLGVKKFSPRTFSTVPLKNTNFHHVVGTLFCVIQAKDYQGYSRERDAYLVYLQKYLGILDSVKYLKEKDMNEVTHETIESVIIYIDNLDNFLSKVKSFRQI